MALKSVLLVQKWYCSFVPVMRLLYNTFWINYYPNLCNVIN